MHVRWVVRAVCVWYLCGSSDGTLRLSDSSSSSDGPYYPYQTLGT
jgi:hypothetical protein